MGLSLRKIKDAVIAQVNPFDHGQTANTVFNGRPAQQTIRPTGLASRNGTIYIDQQARQASQARPQTNFSGGAQQQQQQKPSFISAVTNTVPLGIRDVFDANTANDIAKRNYEEDIKAMNAHLLAQPAYTPKLNQTYTQQQTALGNRSYTNPIQSVAYGLAKDPAKGINSLAGAYAKGLEGTAGLMAIAGSKLANTSDEFQNNLQQEVGNRMSAPIAFSNKGGLLGQGTNFKTAQELDNKKKFASSMVKTGVDVGSVVPVAGGAAQGTGIIAKQGAKQLIGNSLLNAGLSGTQSIATQVNENRPINLKEAGLSTLAGGAVPVAAFGAGRLLKGVSNKVVTAKPTTMNQQGSINPAQAFKDIRDKLNGSALDTTVKPATPENVYGVNALEKLGKKLKMNQGGGIPNPAYDPLDALKAEAKKYKSADEFVKAYESKTRSEYTDRFNKSLELLPEKPRVVKKGITKRSAEVGNTISKRADAQVVENVDAGLAVMREASNKDQSLTGRWMDAVKTKNVPDQYKRYDVIDGKVKTSFVDMSPEESRTFYEKNRPLFQDGTLLYENDRIYSNTPKINKEQLTSLYNENNGIIDGNVYDNNTSRTQGVGQKTGSLQKKAGAKQTSQNTRPVQSTRLLAPQPPKTKGVAPTDKFADMTPEQAKANFEKTWQETYGKFGENKKTTTKTALDTQKEQRALQSETTAKRQQMMRERGITEPDYRDKQAVDKYNEAVKQINKELATPPKGVAPKSAPIEKTPTRAQAINKVAVAASEAPKLKTPNDLLPNGVDETLAKIDAQNKLMFAKSEAPGATPKPKVKSAPKPVVKAAQPTKPNVVKPVDVDAQLEKEIFGTMADPNYKQSTLGKLGETLSPNRQIRKVTQAIEGGINKGLRGSLESGSRIVRTPGRTVAGVSRQAGRTNEELAQYGKLQGGKQMGDELGLKIAQTGDEAIKQGINPTKIADALDPALTSARGGKAPVLTELEQSEVNRLRRIIDLTHEGEHNLGLLNDKVYEANKGTYFPRNFDEFFENDVTRQIAKDNKLDLNIFKNRKDLADIPKEVLEKANRDPYYMTALRTQQYAKNKAVVEHTRWLKDSGSVIDTPKKGYIQVPDSPAYGAIKGKYVLKEQLEDLQGFIYETDSAQHVVALLNTFDRNPARQFLKKTKTVYNPGVRLGNRTFNYLTAGINGINPITYTKNWARANGMMKNKSPEFIEATKEGVFGSSIIDKELYQVGDALTPTKGNVVTKAVRGTDNAITNTYKGVDDKAKMATYLTFRERGVAPAEAAKRTRRAMQNYDMVGQFFDLGAKTPIGGNAFVRFSSELIRMAHNSAVDNPLRLAGAMASVVALTTMASKMSGESEEDRKTREGRLGAPKVPFTNQSLEVQTPYGAINIGRLLGVTTYNDINGGVAEDGKRLLPFQLPITNTKNGVKFNPNFVTSDPLIGPIMGQIIDKDFRGKSIKDPENTGQFLDKLSTKDQVINRAKVAGMSYIPLANEANSLLSAVQGKENFYGKKRSPAQAGLRVAGIKVEQYGPEQAKKQRSIDEYFKEKDALDKEVATLPKKDQEAYKQATGYYKLREQVPNEFSPGETRYKKAPVYDFSENKWGEYASSPKLYDLIMKDKERKAQKGQPLQPEFDKTLSSEFRKQLISNKALAPGEDVEADQRMYQSSEWDTYSKLKDKYTQDAKKYYPSKGDDTFADEMVKHQNAPFPKKGSAKQAYDDAYGLYAKGQGPKPTYTDQVDADKEAYSDAKLKWTNTERKARGLGPISKETWDNVTFGFQSDEEKVYKELKYGNGYGSYSKYSSRGGSSRGGGSGGGGSSSKTGLNSDAPNLYKYAISTTAKTAKPTVKKAGAVAKVGVAMKTKTAKPKVTIKKSKV